MSFLKKLFKREPAEETLSDDDPRTQAIKACLYDISEKSMVDHAPISEAESALEIFILYSAAIKHTLMVNNHYIEAHKFLTLLVDKLTKLLSNSREQIQALIDNRFTIYDAAFEYGENENDQIENALMALQKNLSELRSEVSDINDVRKYFKAILRKAEHIVATRGSPNGNLESNQAKEDLIKNLLKKRIMKSDTIDDPEDFARWVDTLTTEYIMGVPEALIITIVETYALLIGKEWNHYDILSWIEDHRSKIIAGKPAIKAKRWDSEEDLKALRDSGCPFGKGNPSIPKTLAGYIKYRTALEHDNQPGVPITNKSIDETIEKALKFCNWPVSASGQSKFFS